jgi:hypothetical protein
MQKSTKDIAREAVEAEFQRAGKRRKRNNVDSSDDEDDTKAKTRHQKIDMFRGPRPAASSELEQLSAKYRDRVKERREGISVEDGDVTALKFSVEDQLFNDVVSAVESGNRQKLSRISLSNDGIRVPTTYEEAIAFISKPESKHPHTKLGIDVLAYLQKAYLADSGESIQVSAAGRNVQQSIWTFTKAVSADPRDRARSWEVPWEQTFAAANSTSHPDSEENVIDKACVCSPQLLSQILDFYAKHAKKQELHEHSNVMPTLKVLGDSDEDDSNSDIFENVGEYNSAATGSPEGNCVELHQSDKLSSKGFIFDSNVNERKINDQYDPVSTPTEADSLPAVHKLSSLCPLEHDDDVEFDFGGQDYDDDDDVGDSAGTHKRKSNKKKGAQ